MISNSIHPVAAQGMCKLTTEFSKVFYSAALLGVVLQVSGCYTVGGGAPVQQREVISRGEPINRPQLDENPDVIVTPYPSSGAASPRSLPEDDDAVIPRAQTQAAPPPNTAVLALLDSANQQSRSGKLDGASASLERALRIDPRNADIWYRLASVRLQQGQFGLASSLAAKSISLAGNDIDLIEQNEAIIDQANRGER